MIISIVLVTLSFQSSNSSKGMWPQAYRQKVPAIAQGMTGSKPFVMPGPIRWRTADPLKPTPEEEAAYQAYWEPFRRDLGKASALLEKGQLREVVNILEPCMQSYPQGAPAATILADAYFRLGENKEAYRLLSPFASQSAMEPLLMQASLAASLAGEEYKGQRDSVLTSIVDRRSYLKDKPKALSSEQNIRSLQFLSYLAIGTQLSNEPSRAQFYLEKAHAMQPNNAVAANALGSLYIRLNLLDKAEPVIQKGLRTADKETKRFLEHSMRNLAAKRARMKTSSSGS